jgi:nitrite reductase/ring-hydroxylating ferredoxin subunit
MGILGVGLVALKGGLSHAKKLALSIDKVPSLKQVGGSATVKLSRKEVLLIRDSKNSVRAFTARCPHRDCTVHYNKKTTKVDCSCHGSSFDLNGKVLSGPAEKDLKKYEASLSNGQIIVSV